MPRGGARKNAGRKPGVPNKVTYERRNKVREVFHSGTTPLEFLIATMRDEGKEFGVRLDAAKSAAPYVHPRLAAVEHSGELKVNHHEQRLRELLGEIVTLTSEPSEDDVAVH